MTITQKLFVLAAMFFCHIVDDYYLQGILAQMKQRKWWENNAPDEQYKHDYIMALCEHAFSWSFVMSMPLLVVSFITQNEAMLGTVLMSYVFNTVIHAIVDNLKANVQALNLIQDQAIHFVQIAMLWWVALF